MTLSLPRINVSKTTLNGIFSGIIAIGVFVISQPNPAIAPKYVGYISLIVGICRVIVGAMQQDAGTQQAVTPTGEVKVVAAHEIPNDPANTPVKDAK